MQKAHWGFIALAALLIAGGAEAKDPAKKEPAAKTGTKTGMDTDGYKPLRAQIKPLRNEVLAARRAGDDKAEALALCKSYTVTGVRVPDRWGAGEGGLRVAPRAGPCRLLGWDGRTARFEAVAPRLGASLRRP